MIAIVDYQAGNQTSVKRALEHLKVPAEITADPKKLKSASGVIFPGVGAAGQAMRYLVQSGLDDILKELAAENHPFLGICMGCQIMLEKSEENHTATLGIIPGQVHKFDSTHKDAAGKPIKVPHMGWNTMRPTVESCLFEGLAEQDQFYFVHGYYPEPAAEFIMGVTSHGTQFASVFGREGLWAVQFHLEKSGRPGLQILKNFYGYCQKQ